MSSSKLSPYFRSALAILSAVTFSSCTGHKSAPAALRGFGPEMRSEIAAGTAGLEAVLGSAYSSDKESFVGDRCVSAPLITPSGKSEAGFSFQTEMSETQLNSELGFAIGGRARVGVIEYKAAANFLTNSVSNALSVSSVWESSYTFPVDKLVSPALTDTGKSVRPNDDRWNQTCGDEYVAEVTRGAKLFFSIRVDFFNQADKEAFQASFSVSGPLAGAEGALKQASSSFGRRSKVTVSAYQMGGDVSRVTDLFSQGGTGGVNFIQCDLGNFENCAVVIENAVRYATDVRTGFPSQLAVGVLPGPAVLSYRTAKYSALGIYPKNYPHLDDAVKLARTALSDAFEKQYALRVTVGRLLTESTLGTRGPAIAAEKVKIESNLTKILGVSKTCYETPLDCWKEYAGDLHLEPIDETLFIPPSVAQLCRGAGSEADGGVLTESFIRLRTALGASSDLDCDSLSARAAAATVLDLSGPGPDSATPLDLRVVASLGNLRELRVANSQLTDLGAVGGLTNLTALDASNNHLTNLGPLVEMRDLRTLGLSRNFVKDVTPLAGLVRLQRLYADSNLIADLAPLQFFPVLATVNLRGNPLSSESIQKFIAQLNHAVIVNQ